MEQQHTTSELAELITRKHRVLHQLLELARQQNEFIDQGEMDKLLSLLAAKQSLILQLQTLESSLGPFREQDPDARDWPSPEAREACRLESQHCQTLLKEIVLLEKQSEAELVRRRDNTQQRLHGAHAAANARSAYQPSRGRPSSQIDFMSE